MREESDVRVDRLVRLEVKRHLLFLPFIRQDRTDEEHETVWWYTVVQLETLLGTGDGGEHRQPVHSRLDVGSGTVFLRQHRRYTRDLILQPIAQKIARYSRRILRTFGGIIRLIMDVPALRVG